MNWLSRLTEELRSLSAVMDLTVGDMEADSTGQTGAPELLR